MAGNGLRRVCALIAGLCLASGAAYGQHEVFYVDDDYAPDPPVTRNGLSWETSFNELSKALQAPFVLGRDSPRARGPPHGSVNDENHARI